MAEANAIQALDGEQFISLTTYRKNGSAVATPVWFAEQNGKIYVTTGAESWKVKRIRNNPSVSFALGDARGVIHGDTIKGVASLHEMRSATAKTGDKALSQKYGFMKIVFGLMGWIQGRKSIIIEIQAQ